MIKDSKSTRIESEPRSRKPKFNFEKTMLHAFPTEVVLEEDAQEDEKLPIYTRKSRYSEMRDYNEFSRGGQRYHSAEGMSRKHRIS